ncbi:MAG TPA: helix-turn-helix domain-containing protein [Acidiferrobacteraceae bacterium]|nr:helix-turn-helix domain-containing protein [Acidiferrobacteraceae bacterium]HEX20600.1 helix-turn-helix domain-containing protein [Acidiferrobacteraceae bacterium]
MPWKETCVMEQRLKFIADYLKNLYEMSELCRHYGISRKTGYKWVSRYETYSLEVSRPTVRSTFLVEIIPQFSIFWLLKSKIFRISFKEII